MDKSGFFDRVIVINLARRPERMERFSKSLGDWPFQPPQRFEAVDGLLAAPPSCWDKGPGAWGCLLSHRAVLDAAIADQVKSLLVLEDDALAAPNFQTLVEKFLARVPADWDCLMLGAEHLRPPIPIDTGVVRCVASNRSHAYAVRGPFMRILSQFWSRTTNDHCDVVLSSLMRHFNAYAPDPLLIGQDAGHSDVTDRRERLRFLSDAHKETIARTDPRHALQTLLTRVPTPSR